MAKAREFIAEGLAQRAEAKIKVRQPLQSVSVPELPDVYCDIVTEELNVKEVAWNNTRAEHEARLQKPTGDATVEAITNPPVVKIDTEITPELKAEGQMREIVRHVQKARKDAGLDVDNRISLEITTDDPGLRAVLDSAALTDTIKQETLTTAFGQPVKNGYETTVKIDGAGLTIRLSKV
jgi:isoleucyl-tRNA synthetase